MWKSIRGLWDSFEFYPGVALCSGFGEFLGMYVRKANSVPGHLIAFILKLNGQIQETKETEASYHGINRAGERKAPADHLRTFLGGELCYLLTILVETAERKGD